MIGLYHMELGSLSGHEAGRELLRQACGDPLPEIRIAPRGKPYFADSPVQFSITHTRHHAFCALSDRPIGIDAEELDRIINPRLAEKILSPSELERYHRAENPNRALLALWVLKEAAAKCSGEGLRGYPNQTDFDPEDPRVMECNGCLVAVVEQEEGNAV